MRGIIYYSHEGCNILFLAFQFARCQHGYGRSLLSTIALVEIVLISVMCWTCVLCDVLMWQLGEDGEGAGADDDESLSDWNLR